MSTCRVDRAVPADKQTALSYALLRAMTGRTRLTARVCLALCAAACASCGAAWGEENATQLAADARVWLSSLDNAQRSLAALPFAGDDRVTWTYLPQVRKGLAFKDQTTSQQSLAEALLKSALSAAGAETFARVRSLEKVLRDDMGEPATVRDPDKYYVAIFGEPSDTGDWGLRFEGHHISLNFTMHDGKMIASTPQFFGANPQEVRVGPKSGFRAIGEYEDLGRALVLMLEEPQRAKAIGPDAPPADILTRFDPVATPPDASQGIAYADLTEAQRSALMKILETAAGVQRPAMAQARLAKAKTAGLDAIRFYWLGDTAPGKPHYYRVQGPTFVFEYDNTQNGANHSHTVWRDFAGDFGRDVLRDHLQAYHRRTLSGVVDGAI